jgi:hypothetical protein
METIVKKSSPRWKPEDEEYLLLSVKTGPLVPEWDKIADAIGRSSAVCKTRYTELVTPFEQVRESSGKATKHDIDAIIAEKRSTCVTCHCVFYHPPWGGSAECLKCYKAHPIVEQITTETSYRCDTCACDFNTVPREWRGVKECLSCYSAHAYEIDLMWKTLIDPGARCRFCECDVACAVHFEFDHANMFEKGGSVCAMVRRGESVELIRAEIKKCQIVCKSCHWVVTELENRVGFRRAKTNMTRAANGSLKGGEKPTPETTEKLRAEYSAMYTATIERLYPIIKSAICGDS